MEANRTAEDSAQPKLGEVGGVIAPISGEQLIGVPQSVRANQKVGDNVLPGLNADPAFLTADILQRAALRASELRRATTQVVGPGSARPVERIVAGRLLANAGTGEEAVQVCLVGKVVGQFGIDRFADQYGACLDCF